LTDSHAQLQAAHEAELQSTAANHAAELSSLAATHSKAVGELKEQVQVLSSQLDASARAEGTLQIQVSDMTGKLAKADNEVKSAREAVEGNKQGRDAEKKLEVVLKELAGVRDELEGTKEVSFRPAFRSDTSGLLRAGLGNE
jgi:uncharacterized protein YgiM (DUF1202 family)